MKVGIKDCRVEGLAGRKKEPPLGKKSLFFLKSPFGEKKGRPRPLEQHRIRPKNLQKTTPNHPKIRPGAPPGCPGGAPGGPEPVLELLDLS